MPSSRTQEGAPRPDTGGAHPADKSRWLDRPWFLAVFVAAVLICLPLAVWLDLRNLSTETLSSQARDVSVMISDIRGYHANNVVGRILAANGKAAPVHNYQDVPGGIPIPATLSPDLGAVIGQRARAVQYRFVSDYPFKGRAPHQLSAFETCALQAMRGAADPNAIQAVDVQGGLFDRSYHLALPVVMEQGCVSCHNIHPESPKRDWKVGDVRGLQVVTIEQPIARNLLSFKYLLGYFILAGSCGLAFVLLQMRQARQVARLNEDLASNNRFLASISMKIARYLSPQIYRSIFAGEKDAVITTERKRLTIFFSDIKDFTSTTESLQPEELTRLLNEYFTAMSAIALEHGATIDKFIGDAILAFFGDPETRGAKEDALACVRMAIAMQRRLDELNETWRAQGIEFPFRAHMGINTGFCNVGNFGSESRMDYTIIGAEANLAARLESVAQPGGIVMSYETYALVKDHIRAHALEPITLKGIARQVVPYTVEEIRMPRAASPEAVITGKAPGFDLKIEPDKLSPEDAREAEAVLTRALAEARKRAQ